MRGRWLWPGIFAACADLPDPSTVVDLRVLAMTVEPPEIIADAPLPEITATPLIADPAGQGRPVTWTLRACANDPRAPTAPGSGTEAASNYPAGGARSSVGSARCPPDGPTSWTLIGDDQARPAGGSLTFRLTGDQLATALASDVFPGYLGGLHGGFDLGLPITLDLQAHAGGGDEVAGAVKRVLFWPRPLRAGQRPNQNPVVREVRGYADRDPQSLDPAGAVMILPPDQPTSISAGESLWLEPAGADAEPYLTTVVDRLTDETRVHEVPAETLRYTFYATAGKFSLFETASELLEGATSPGHVHIESRYIAPLPRDLPVDAQTGGRELAVTIWIVVRDERGGASWIERRLLVRSP